MYIYIYVIYIYVIYTYVYLCIYLMQLTNNKY